KHPVEFSKNKHTPNPNPTNKQDPNPGLLLPLPHPALSARHFYYVTRQFPHCQPELPDQHHFIQLCPGQVRNLSSVPRL
ncbi:hypothetical protein AB0I61_33840, partial [Polymorphospora rubra]